MNNSRRLMRIAIDDMLLHVQTLDSKISRVKSNLSTTCPSILMKDIIESIRMLNSRLYSFLLSSKASKFNSLLGSRPVSAPNHTSLSSHNNLVVTIPPDLHLSDSERSVLAKGLKFVPSPGSLNLFSVKTDTEQFFRRLRLKAFFHDQSSVPNKDVFETLISHKKSSCSPDEGQFGSLDLFIRQSRHDIDQLLTFRPKRPSNLSNHEFEALKSLRVRSDIVIKPADKGGAVVVWRAELYRTEARRQLSDTTFYSRVDKDLTSTHQDTISHTIRNFIQTGDLPETARDLIATTPRTPVMYFLPKIHKPNDPGRPIVSACGCPTEIISSYLDHVMAPLVRNLPSYIKDTKHALQILNNIHFHGNHKFNFTMDVKCLYTVIPHHDSLKALKFFFDKRPNQEPSTTVLIRLAELVLTLNNFSFDGEHYQQISGVAMGTKMGPNYANLFVGFVENQIFEQYTDPVPDFFGRFIDDCLGTASCSYAELESFIHFVNNFHPALKFTWEISETSVSFLDILISINGSRLTTSVFYKPTDSHSYLLFSSSHPNHTKRSIPFSQFLRLRRICSEDEDFQTKSCEMRNFFVQRGYPTSLLDTAFSRASSIPRSNTLTNSVHNGTDNNKIPLVLTYHPFNFKVRDVIRKNFHILKNDPQTSSIFSENPLVSFRQNKNIRESLVSSSLTRKTSLSDGTFPCKRGNCKTCDYIDSTTTISAPKSNYKIKHLFSCASSHLIYCISCSRCSILYIGETGRTLRTRFGEHRRAVQANDVHQPVARHFNAGNHCISDMKIRALCPVSGSNDSRKKQEMSLISKLGTLQPLGINERFSYL